MENTLSGFSFTIEMKDEDQMVVHPNGSLDFHTVGLIKKAIFPLITDEEIYSVVFDYSLVDYADSSSFGLLLKVNRALGGRVSVVNAKPNLRKLFKLAGFDGIFLQDAGYSA